jgi:hypothetical protein
MSNVQTQVCRAKEVTKFFTEAKGGTSKGIGNPNSAFEKTDRLVEQKLAGSQFH